MAFGLRSARKRGGQPNNESTNGYSMDPTGATKIHKGDPVNLGTAGVIAKSGAATAFDGVFMGVSFLDLTGTPTFSPFYPGANTGTEHVALVMDDPDSTFEIETSANIAVTDIGKFASFTLTAGSDVTGVSNAVLNQASVNATSTGLPVRILRIVEAPTDGSTTQTVEVERTRVNN